MIFATSPGYANGRSVGSAARLLGERDASESSGRRARPPSMPGGRRLRIADQSALYVFVVVVIAYAVYRT
jgi:hypothetical protein